MENNKKTNYIRLSITVLLFLVLILALVLAYKLIFLDKVSVTNESSDIIINEDKYKKVINPTNYGTPISTSEEGFGRENPFLPYK